LEPRIEPPVHRRLVLARRGCAAPVVRRGRGPGRERL